MVVNKNSRGKMTRVDEKTLQMMRLAARQRLMRHQDENPRELSDRELFRMLRNTQGFELSLEEMIKLPRKRAKR